MTLQLGSQHLLSEDAARLGEHAPEESFHKLPGDPIPQAARVDRFAFVFEILELFEESFLDEILGTTLVQEHPAPDLRNDEADVMIDPVVRPDVPRCGAVALVSTHDIAKQCRIEINDRKQGVEWPLRQGPFGSGPRCRGRLPSQTRDKVHEELRQFLEMDWPENSERTDPRIVVRRIVSPARKNCMHGVQDRLIGPEASIKARAQFAEVFPARILEIRSILKIPGIFTRLPVNETRMGRTDNVLRARIDFHEISEDLFHRFGEMVKPNRVFDDLLPLLARLGLVVGKEISPFGKIEFRLLVVSAMDRFIRSLEKAILAVFRELVTGETHIRMQKILVDGTTGNDERCRDIILALQLGRGSKVFPQTKHPPRSVFTISDSQIPGHHGIESILQEKPWFSIDHVDAKAAAPVVPPVRLPVSLQSQNEIPNRPRNGGDELVVFIGESIAVGKETHHRPE